MTVKQAIRKADELRPNAIPDETKAALLFGLEGELAEMMETEAPENTWPEEDYELMMPYPHDEMYYLYLMAMIDNANEETALYQNDMAVAQQAINESRAWWWRNNYKRTPHMIEVM